MKVGDYVRTDIGEIRKVVRVTDDVFVLDKDIVYAHKDKIKKSSPNIIDLIEVGDYVNGWRVNKVEKEEDGVILTIGTITSFVSKNEKEPYLTQDYNEPDKLCKLKSIVTKEQFSSMEYKVESEVK